MEILRNLWRFSASHPDWEESDDDWGPEVAWWTARTLAGLVLIDPLVEDWDLVDGLVEAAGGCRDHPDVLVAPPHDRRGSRPVRGGGVGAVTIRRLGDGRDSLLRALQ